jgi:membrane protein DedA with SNARE-associated domain/rhodanese-related sulfurtransferase
MTDSSQLNYFGVLLAVFANQLCLPIPSVFVLMAAGALSAHGRMSATIIVTLSVCACLVADGIWFWFGRRWGSQAIRMLCRLTPDPREAFENAQDKFQRYGVPVLCVNKFVPGLDGIMPPLVGAEGVSLLAFLSLDGLGSVLWSGAYVTLGYVFSDQLDVAFKWGKHFGAAVGIAIAVVICVYAGSRGLAMAQMIRRLRVRRIGPATLYSILKSRKVAVLDLLEFEAETESPNVIPGAMRVQPSRLRHTGRITVPEDVEVVLYSSSGDDTVSARAAMGLKRIGIENVWVLKGGLNAWLAQGFPVSKSPETAEAVAARLGVKLPAEAVTQ